jgi:hypothetical protein
MAAKDRIVDAGKARCPLCRRKLTLLDATRMVALFACENERCGVGVSYVVLMGAGGTEFLAAMREAAAKVARDVGELEVRAAKEAATAILRGADGPGGPN